MAGGGTHEDGTAAGGRRTFLVGRVTPSSTVVRLVEPRPAPLPGPWSLQAVVRPTGPRLRVVR